MPRPSKTASLFAYFHSSPEIIPMVVMLHVRFPLSLRNVEDLMAERGIDISYETVRLWLNRFGPMVAADIKRQRISRMKGYTQWRWNVDKGFAKINGDPRQLALQLTDLGILRRVLRRLRKLPFPCIERMLAHPEPLRNFRYPVAPLNDLRHRIALELVGEISLAHRRLLSSKLEKKASTNLGAIQLANLWLRSHTICSP